MRPNPQFPADLVTFTGEILNGKLHFLCSANENGINKAQSSWQSKIVYTKIFAREVQVVSFTRFC